MKSQGGRKPNICQYCHTRKATVGYFCSEACRLAEESRNKCDIADCTGKTFNNTPYCRKHHDQLKKFNESLFTHSGYKDKGVQNGTKNRGY